MIFKITVNDSFNVEKYRDLEIPLKSQSRSLKVVPFDRLGLVFYYCYVLLLVFYSIFVRKTTIFDYSNSNIRIYSKIFFLRYSTSNMQ